MDSNDRRRVSILGVRLDLTGVDQSKAKIRAYLSDPWDGTCRHIVTLNPEYVMAAQRSKQFCTEIADADLVLADGIGVVVAAKLLAPRESTSIERITGVDLVNFLAATSREREAQLFLLGAGPGVAEEAARALAQGTLEARIAGFWGGGTSDPRYDSGTLEKIAASGARSLVVAYGAPAQVHWIVRNQIELAKCGVRLAVGVGGAFDYLAGTAPHAPELVRRAGLEWLYRLIREPWRWKRQRVLPVFAVRVVGSWLWMRGNRSQSVSRSK